MSTRRVGAELSAASVLLTRKSGSPEDIDLERASPRGPTVKHLRDMFATESGAQSPSRTFSVLSAREYRGGELPETPLPDLARKDFRLRPGAAP